MQTFKLTCTFLAALLLMVTLHAQTGAGTNSKTYPLADFNQIQIDGINGEVDIRVGQAFSVTATGNSAMVEELDITKSGNQLVVKLKKQTGDQWRNNKPVNIAITLPALSALHNASNADVHVSELTGGSFLLKNDGNGDIALQGSSVEQLNVRTNGNGDVDAKGLTASDVSIHQSGNGNVAIKTAAAFTVSMSGNGDVINYGKGKANIATQSGNGEVLYRD